MARIAPVARGRAPLLLRLLNAASRRAVGAETAHRQMTTLNPRFLRTSLPMVPLTRGPTELDPAVRALAMQLVAEINGCALCLDFGRAEAEEGGVPAAKLLAVADHATDPCFLPDERAALAYAAAVTEIGARVSDDLFAELRRHFSDRGIVELTVAVATENLCSRISAPPGIEAQGSCAAPPFRAVVGGAG